MEKVAPGEELWVALDPKGKQIENTYTGEFAFGKTPEEAHLSGQLAEEGNQMGHCVGGHCEGVASGEIRIFSLRDAKGKSHVTVEVEPSAGVQHWGREENGRGQINVGTEERPVWKDAEDLPDNISQIKGKQNRAPEPKIGR